jgi:hypothetical protein
MAVPLMNEAPSEARKVANAATSSDLLRRPCPTVATSSKDTPASAANWGTGALKHGGVYEPGADRVGAHALIAGSSAIASVIRTTPALVAE